MGYILNAEHSDLGLIWGFQFQETKMIDEQIDNLISED